MNRKLIIALLIAVLPFAANARFNNIADKVKNKEEIKAEKNNA